MNKMLINRSVLVDMRLWINQHETQTGAKPCFRYLPMTWAELETALEPLVAYGVTSPRQFEPPAKMCGVRVMCADDKSLGRVFQTAMQLLSA